MRGGGFESRAGEEGIHLAFGDVDARKDVGREVLATLYGVAEDGIKPRQVLGQARRGGCVDRYTQRGPPAVSYRWSHTRNPWLI